MPKRGMTPQDLLDFKFVGDTQVSPDGASVLFSVRTITDKNKYLSHIWEANISSGDLTQYTQGEKSASSGRYSPNGDTISFVAKRDDESAQIYLLPRRGGEAKALTKLPEGDLGWYSWSPDGKWILISYRLPEENRTEKAAKQRKEKGESPPPFVTESYWFRLDGDGYFGSARFHLYLVDAATGEHTLLYDKDPLGMLSCDWLPDSSGVVVCHSQKDNPMFGDPDDGFWIVNLKGKAKKIKTSTKGSKENVKVSPSGKWLAYFGDDQFEGWGVNNTRLWKLPIEGGEATCLTREVDEDMDVLTLSDTNAGHTADGGGGGLLAWSEDESHIYVSIGRRGEVQLGKVSTETGQLELITSGRHSCVAGGSTKNRSVFSGYRGSDVMLNEVVLIDSLTGAIEDLTSFNQKVYEEIEIIGSEDFEVVSTDGAKVHGWIMKPLGAKDKKYPAVLEIHGGPHAQYGWAFFHEFQVLAAQGYVVVFSNPRGSKGYGEAWTKAIKSNWGDKDWDDIQAITKWMMSHPNIDSKKMGVMGGSYGGYMTNWVIGHTHDFKAAISDRCVSNLVSFVGNCDFPANDREYFGGVPYGGLDRIAELWRQSPLAYFEGVKTPTLIIHSEGDLRCNIEQADQVFHALQAQGVESRYVRYPVNTSHGMSRGGPPDLRLHRLDEIVRWWEKHLK